MNLTLTTPPAEEAVSLAEAKLYCRVDYTADDAVITGLLRSARQYAEGYLKRGLVTQTWTLTADTWDEITDRCGRMRLPMPPLLSVTSVKFYSGGTLQTIPGDTYIVCPGTPGRIEATDGWPSHDDRPDAIAIEYTVGYGDAEDVPPTVKTAILMLVAHWYEHREAATEGSLTEIPIGVEPLLQCEGWSH